MKAQASSGTVCAPLLIYTCPPAAASVPHPVRPEPPVRRAVSLQTIMLATDTALASPLRRSYIQLHNYYTMKDNARGVQRARRHRQKSAAAWLGF